MKSLPPSIRGWNTNLYESLILRNESAIQARSGFVRREIARRASGCHWGTTCVQPRIVLDEDWTPFGGNVEPLEIDVSRWEDAVWVEIDQALGGEQPLSDAFRIVLERLRDELPWGEGRYVAAWWKDLLGGLKRRRERDRRSMGVAGRRERADTLRKIAQIESETA